MYRIILLVLSWLNVPMTGRSHNPVDSAYIDFSKAFDSVCHYKLICKLRSLGIGGKLLAWIGEYLSDRTLP